MTMDDTPQILVAGGGTAGCAAAIAAARRGRRVLLVEEGNALGGVSTAGGVSEWFAELDGLGDIWERVIIGLLTCTSILYKSLGTMQALFRMRICPTATGEL